MGLNGQQCLASAITQSLLPFKNDFSIINGVFIDKTFDSHTNMTDLFFSGSPFGGNSFAPWINTKSQLLPQLPLDGLKKNGGSLSSDSAHTTLVELNSGDTSSLIEDLKLHPLLSKAPEAWSFALERMSAGALLNPTGQWSQGSQNLHDNLLKAQSLAHRIGSLDMSTLDSDPDLHFLDLFRRMIQQKMTRMALESTSSFGLMQDSLFYDSHSVTNGDDIRSTYTKTAEKLAKTLQYFKTTAYDNQRSLLDVTTIVVTTEFGRTMRQDGQPIDKTGTDHNTLCNSVFMAGKGIRGGQVIGSSDFEVYDEVLSGAHLELDPMKIKVMAKPFDFSTGQSVLTKPPVFIEDQYLHVNNVINTLFDLFGLPKELYRRKNVGANPYTVIRSLLK